jgi:hypothetical protein
MTGGKKPVGLPEDFDHDGALALFTEHPEAFMAGPQRQVTPDPFRRPITRRDFVDAHLRAGSRPFGHGFTERNRLDGTAYYVHDTPAVRFIALDTNCLAGGASGCLDARQARWLEIRLAEVHSAYRGADGGESGPGTTTGWWSCSPITAPTRWTTAAAGTRDRTASRCSVPGWWPCCTGSPTWSCG